MISDDLRFVRWQDPAKIGSHSRSHRNVSSCEARPLLCQDLARASSLRNAHSFGMPGATLIKNTLQLGVDQGPYYPKGKYIYIEWGDLLIITITASPKTSKKSSPWRNLGRLLSESMQRNQQILGAEFRDYSGTRYRLYRVQTYELMRFHELWFVSTWMLLDSN